MELLEYIHKGGVIAWVLIIMGTFGISIVLYKMGEFYQLSRSLERVWGELALANPSGTHIKEHIALFVSKKEYGLPTVRTIATISPLLGLLGTVLGVLLAFEQITLLGLDDPKVFSEGISLALITTVVGLGVAIPHYIAYNYLIHRLDLLQTELESKSNP